MERETQTVDELVRAAFSEDPPLERLGAVRALQSLLDGLCVELVQAGRAENASWAQVGDALGVTRPPALLGSARSGHGGPSDGFREEDAGQQRAGMGGSGSGWFPVLEIVRRR